MAVRASPKRRRLALVKKQREANGRRLRADANARRNAKQNAFQGMLPMAVSLGVPGIPVKAAAKEVEKFFAALRKEPRRVT